MKILITGHSGSIGSSLVPYLEDQGHTVVKLKSDIRDSIEIEREIRNNADDADIVMHLAAIVTSIPSELAGKHTYDVNVTGTYNVATAAHKHNLRLCYFSTTVLYKPGRSPYNEDTRPEPDTAYAHTKWLGEQTAKFIYRNDKDKLLVVRPCFTYGSKKDHSMITNLIRASINNEPIIVRLDPELKKVYTHLDDFSEAVEKLISGKHCGEFNVTSDEVHTFQEVLDILKAQGIEPRMYLRPDMDYLHDHVVENHKLVQTIDWKPKVNLEEGIRRIIASLS